MSVVEASREETTAPCGPLAIAVAEKLRLAEARLTELEIQVGDLALDEALNSPGAGEKMAVLDKQLRSTEDEVSRLTAALQRATERDEAAEKEDHRAAQKIQFAEFRRHVDARQRAIGKLATALQQAAVSYQKFLAVTDSMVAALPDGTAMPPGLLGAGDLGGAQTAALIAGEMYRWSGVSQIGDRGGLPGSRPPSEFLRYQPQNIEPAAEVVRRMNEHLLSFVANQLERA